MFYILPFLLGLAFAANCIEDAMAGNFISSTIAWTLCCASFVYGLYNIVKEKKS